MNRLVRLFTLGVSI